MLHTTYDCPNKAQDEIGSDMVHSGRRSLSHTKSAPYTTSVIWKIWFSYDGVIVAVATHG